MKRAAIAVAMLVVGAVAVATALPGGVSKDQQVGDQAAAFVLAQAPGAAAAPSAAAKPLPDNPGFYAGEAGLSSVRDRRPRDLVQGDRRQRALPHLHLPAARRRAGRLVPRAALPTSATTASPRGASSTIPAAASRATEGCPAKSLDETYGFDWCPGDDELLKFVGKRGLPRPGVRLPRRAARPGRSAQAARRPAPVGVRSRVRHVDRRARLSQVSQSALRPRSAGEKLNGGLAQLGGLPQDDDPADRQVGRCARAPARRRLDRAAVPDRHVVRLVPHRVRSARIRRRDPARPKWENIKGAIGNQYPRMSELLGLGDAATTRSSSRCSRTRGPARPTRPRSRTTR